MTNEPLDVALIGIGGYGQTYLSSLLEHRIQGVRFVAAVDPAPNGCQLHSELRARGIPVLGSLDELYRGYAPHLTVISAPAHVHHTATITALSQGSHVLCEKPLCSTPEQGMELIEARDRSARQVLIGYQWSYSEGIQELKRHIIAGVFGRPRRMRSLVLWPRSEKYYRRNGWSGRPYASCGLPVFDSPLNNACAHHLHNMLFLLGDAPDRSVMPASVMAELYRANNIEIFDTAVIRVRTVTNVELQLVASHATEHEKGPWFTFEFENATVTFHGVQPTIVTSNGPPIVARFHTGATKVYPNPEREPDRKLSAAVLSARRNRPGACGIETSLPQVLVAAAANQSVLEPVTFPSRLIQVTNAPDDPRIWVQGLDQILLDCHINGQMPHELGVPWASVGREIDLTLGDCSRIADNGIARDESSGIRVTVAASRISTYAAAGRKEQLS